MTDNGPNLVSDKFAKFAESWNFLHTTSSPYYSCSDGKAEGAVKIAKTLLQKVKRSKLDFYEALLNLRNTPTEGVNASLSQQIFSRYTKTSTVVKNLKNHLVRHGIPDEVMTDNGPNLVGDKFAKFADSWNFLHTTSSPYYSRSNGKAEAAVKITKTLLRKVKCSKQDFYEALLDWRNTPTEGVNASPSQQMFS